MRPRPSRPRPIHRRRPEWLRLYDRCLELGVVGIESREPSLRELRAALADRLA